jgi:DNA-directed RNA polymerase specialized sigma24 family protein
LSDDVSDPRKSNGGTENVEPCHRDQQRIILEIAARALESGDRDPEEVFHVAEKVGLKAHLIVNLRAYASRALFRVKKRPQLRAEQLTEIQHAAALTDNSQVERIEARILVRELLDVLSPTDREIFLRLMNGQTCPEIDAAMNLKRRTAESRLAVCKNALRRAVAKKLKS